MLILVAKLFRNSFKNFLGILFTFSFPRICARVSRTTIKKENCRKKKIRFCNSFNAISTGNFIGRFSKSTGVHFLLNQCRQFAPADSTSHVITTMGFHFSRGFLEHLPGDSIFHLIFQNSLLWFVSNQIAFFELVLNYSSGAASIIEGLSFSRTQWITIEETASFKEIRVQSRRNPHIFNEFLYLN